MSRHWGLLQALLALAFCATGPVAAQEQGIPQPLAPAVREPTEITADTLVVDRRRQLYEARGNVTVREARRTLRADWALLNGLTERGVASGRVVVEQAGDTLYASFLHFDTRGGTGVVFDGHLDAPAGGFDLRGERIARTGEQTYHFEDSVFTTCRCDDAEARRPWEIAASDMDLEVGGYAVARDARFRVLGVPVFWLPWMIYPVKNQRQTGFLFPDFAYGRRNGFELGVPFFWAPRPDLNVTLTPSWLEKRGGKGDLEIEYKLGRESEGRLFAAGLYDHKVDPGTAKTPFGRGRWSVAGQHDLHAPAGLRLKSDFAFVSDNEYPFDFRELEDRRRDRFLESVAFAGRSFGRSGGLGLWAGAFHADDLQSPDDEDRDRFLLNRLPRVELQALPARLPRIPGVVTAFDLEYTHFRPRERAGSVLGLAGQVPSGGAAVVGRSLFLDTGRDGIPSFDERNFPGTPDPHGDDFDALTNPLGPEGDGIFQEGEALADRGHRIDLWPRIGVPLRAFDALELYGEAGWRETLYFTQAQDFEQRGFFTGETEVRTRLERRFGALRHLLEPRLGWALLTKAHQSGNPIFVPDTAVPQERLRQLDLKAVVADPADRVARAHTVTLGFGNRVYRDAGSEGSPGSALVGPALLADVTLSGRYDIARDRFGGIFLDGRLEPFPLTSFRGHFGFDPERGSISEGLADLTWTWPQRLGLGLEYRYLRDVPSFFEGFDPSNDRFDDFEPLDRVSQLHGSVRVHLGPRWTARYGAIYSFEDSLLLWHRGALEYFSRCECWAAGVALSHSRNSGLQFNVLYRFVGLGGDRRMRWAFLDDL